MIYAILALSLELLVGTTGLVCFGQAALFGLAGYAAVQLSPPDAAASLFWLLPVSMAVAAAYALFMGALSLRTRGVYFIMVTLAFAQMAYYVVHDTPLGGGTDGIYLALKPVAAIGATVLLDLDDAMALYYFVLGALAVVFVFLALLLRSPFGRALAGIRINEQRMRATGFSTYPYKLAAFVHLRRHCRAGRLPVRGEGRLCQPRTAELAPFGGGAGDDHPGRHRPPARRGDRRLRLRAAAGILQVRGDLRRLLQALAAGPGADHHRQRGAAAARPDRRRRAAQPSPATPRGRHAVSEVLLRASQLTRRFGGLVAVDGVSLELQRGTVHAVIGTNGAGKSTLINILSGELAASSGRVELRGTDITRWSQPRRARAGIGRSYQRTTIYPVFTVLENCRLAAQARHPRPWAWWTDAAACPHSVPAARDAAARAGLAELAGPAGRHAVARPAAAAGDRHVPGHRSPRCCCWTNPWPAWAPRRPSACWRCWAS